MSARTRRAAQVTVADSEPAESALRRFRKSVLNSGVLPEVRRLAATCPRLQRRTGTRGAPSVSRANTQPRRGLRWHGVCTRRRGRLRSSGRASTPLAWKPYLACGRRSCTLARLARIPVTSVIPARGSALALSPARFRSDAPAVFRSSAAATLRTRRTSRSASNPLASRRCSGESRVPQARFAGAAF